jgi:hypothetical protein
VQRVVRPQNVWLGEDGRARLTSAGLAEAAHDSGLGLRGGADPERHAARAPSPEQSLGLPADARSDVYAAGMLLHDLLAERGGAEVTRVLRRATDEEPGGRHADAAELRSALWDAVGSTGSGVFPGGTAPPPPPLDMPAPPSAPAGEEQGAAPPAGAGGPAGRRQESRIIDVEAASAQARQRARRRLRLWRPR